VRKSGVGVGEGPQGWAEDAGATPDKGRDGPRVGKVTVWWGKVGRTGQKNWGQGERPEVSQGRNETGESQVKKFKGRGVLPACSRRKRRSSEKHKKG